MKLHQYKGPPIELSDEEVAEMRRWHDELAEKIKASNWQPPENLNFARELLGYGVKKH